MLSSMHLLYSSVCLGPSRPCFIYIYSLSTASLSPKHTLKKKTLDFVGKPFILANPISGKPPCNALTIVDPSFPRNMMCHDSVQVALSLSLSRRKHIVLFVAKVCQPPVVQSTLLHPLPWPVFWTVGWTLIPCFIGEV